MLGRLGLKYFLIASVCLMCNNFVYSDEFDYAQAQRRVPVQEEFGDYMAGVREQISKNWTPPEVTEEGHATVIFKLDRNGNVISAYIKESSGDKFYDASALNSVEKAAPYQKFPESSTRENLTIVYSFDSSVVSANQLKELVAESEKYVNRDNLRARNIIDQAIKSIEGDPASYFLYARRSKLDKLIGDTEAAKTDLGKSKMYKIAYDKRRIAKCKDALAQDETPFAYFTLANAYELAGDYQNAISNIDKAISMTQLNQAYKRYRAELIMKSDK